MKKVSMMFVIMFAVICMQLYVFADMDSPKIKAYEAYVSNVNGAEYYEWSGEQVGKLEYGEKITILYETKMQSKDRSVYGAFSLNGNDSNEYVKLTDITIMEGSPVEATTEKVDFENPIEVKVLANDGIEIYQGPAYAYSKIGVKIPKGTILKVYAFEDNYNPWYYVTYNGKSGWICELNGAIGFEYKEDNIEYIKDEAYIIYEDTERTKVIGYKPAGEMPTEIIDIDIWSKGYYITCNNVSGYITWSSFVVEVNNINTKMYKEADINSEILLETIPKGTELIVSNVKKDDFYPTYYNGNIGYIHESFVDREEEENEETEENVTNIIKEQKIEETKKEKMTSGEQIVMICMFVAIIVFVTSFVMIMLVNKNNEKNADEKIQNDADVEKENKE